MKTGTNTMCKAVQIRSGRLRECGWKTEQKGRDYCAIHENSLGHNDMYDKFGIRTLPRFRGAKVS